MGVLVSKANPSGGDSLPGASGSNFKVWNFEEELENNPELKAYWYSADGSVDRQSLALSHQIYRLRLVRRKLGITQVELAKRMGVSQIRVSQIENGKLESFELGTLIRYVEALGGKLSMSVELDGKSLELLNIAPDTLEVWGD